jgi:hypothetical protein
LVKTYLICLVLCLRQFLKLETRKNHKKDGFFKNCSIFMAKAISGSPIFSRPIILSASYTVTVSIQIDAVPSGAPFSRWPMRRCSCSPLAEAAHCTAALHPTCAMASSIAPMMLSGLPGCGNGSCIDLSPVGLLAHGAGSSVIIWWVPGSVAGEGDGDNDKRSPLCLVAGGRHGCIAVWDASTRGVLPPLAQPR